MLHRRSRAEIVMRMRKKKRKTRKLKKRKGKKRRNRRKKMMVQQPNRLNQHWKEQAAHSWLAEMNKTSSRVKRATLELLFMRTVLLKTTTTTQTTTRTTTTKTWATVTTTLREKNLPRKRDQKPRWVE